MSEVQRGWGVVYGVVRRVLWVLSVYFEHEAQIVYQGVGRVSWDAAEEDGTAGNGGMSEVEDSRAWRRILGGIKKRWKRGAETNIGVEDRGKDDALKGGGGETDGGRVRRLTKATEDANAGVTSHADADLQSAARNQCDRGRAIAQTLGSLVGWEPEMRTRCA